MKMSKNLYCYLSVRSSFSIKMESFKHPAKLREHTCQLITEHPHCNVEVKRQHAPFPVSQSARCARISMRHNPAPCSRCTWTSKFACLKSYCVIIVIIRPPRAAAPERKDNGPIACYHSSAGTLQIHIKVYILVHIYSALPTRVLGAHQAGIGRRNCFVGILLHRIIIIWCIGDALTTWRRSEPTFKASNTHTHLFFLSRSRLTSVCCCCLRCACSKGHITSTNYPRAPRFKVISVKRLASQASLGCSNLLCPWCISHLRAVRRLTAPEVMNLKG
jgi:hypothetical protein